MSHRSELLEGYIDKTVNIELKSHTVRRCITGILRRNTVGFRPYKLVTKDYEFIFSKSEVKDIKEVKP